MFIGEYSHNLDNKGRLAIPAKFRNKLKDGAIVTRGLDNCLFLYSKEIWAKEAEKLSGLDIKQSNARSYVRMMLSGAMEVEFDSQGRVTLPDYLRKFAKLEKNAILAGLYDRIEIWDKNEWERYKEEAEKHIESIAENLGN